MMGAQFGNTKIGAMQYGGVTIGEAMMDGQIVYQSDQRPVVTIIGGSSAQAQFRQACIDHGTTYNTVETLPFRLDTSQVTNTRYMFQGCSSLTQVPDLDTSQVTNMEWMFEGCSSLTQVPDLDTSQVTSMGFMFEGCSSLTHAPDMDTSSVTDMKNMFQNCSSLTTVPDLDTSNATNMIYMFRNCSPLTDGNVRLFGKHPNVSTYMMIQGSGLTREPFYDVNGNPI